VKTSLPIFATSAEPFAKYLQTGWFWTSENSIVNVTDMTKYGFYFGQVVLTMRKVE